MRTESLSAMNLTIGPYDRAVNRVNLKTISKPSYLFSIFYSVSNTVHGFSLQFDSLFFNNRTRKSAAQRSAPIA